LDIFIATSELTHQLIHSCKTDLSLNTGIEWLSTTSLVQMLTYSLPLLTGFS